MDTTRARVITTAIALPPPRLVVASLGVTATSALAFILAAQFGTKQTALFGIGVALGLVLLNARFGFASAFRQLVAVGQGRALRAHVVMLATASVLFAALLAYGQGFAGVKLQASIAPIALSLFIGAFLFGVGMQLAGACASGTLYSIGGGQSSLLLTLGGFIAGSTVGAWGTALWAQQPQLPAVSLIDRLGTPGALVVQLTALTLVVVISLIVERRRRPPVPEEVPSARGWMRALRGAWPLWAAAIALAALNALTFAVKGSPWGIAGAFTLWGSQLAATAGVPVETWSYWSKPAPLHQSVLADATSVMNFGIVLGALVAAALSGTFSIGRGVPWRVAVAAVLGGVLMGYGARIGYGCNIGAYFGGIASFSLHGWIWGACAIAGTVAGLRLRPLFGMRNPRPTDAVC